MTMERARAFWEASAEWYAQRRETVTRRKGAGLGGAEQIVRKELRWKKRAASYLSHRPDLPHQLIRVDPSLSETVGKMIDAVAPKLAAAYDRHLSALAFDAWRKWPVDSGLSKSLLALEFSVSPDGSTFTGTIRNRAPYVFFIKGSPHRKLLDQPGKQVAIRIGQECIDELAKEGP
jgi:hypothetical protein